MGAIYPQSFALRWGEWNAIHLRDLALIGRYRELARTTVSEHNLTDLLLDDGLDNKTPYDLLAKIFEYYDAAIFAMGGLLSGHTLKHLVAALAPLALLAALRRRNHDR